MYMRSVGEGKGLVPNYAHVLPACPYVKLFYEINIVIVHLYSMYFLKFYIETNLQTI